MAGKPIDPELAATIVAEWRTGAYSIRDLAKRHDVSHGVCGKLCKGVIKDMATTVDAGLLYMGGLAGHDGQLVDAVRTVVDERTKHMQFFTNAAVRNVSMAVKKLSEETSQAEHRLCAETISKGRDTVLGKEPAVQIDNKEGGQMIVNIVRYTDEPE